MRTLSRLFAWAVLVATAFLAADLVSAGVERSLQAPPRPFEVAPAVPAAPRQAGSLDSLQVVLRQPAPDAAAAGPGGAKGGGAKGAAPAKPTNMTLQGTMLGAGGSGLAFIEVGGKVQAVGVGETVGGFELARVESTWVGLKRDSQAVELRMETTDSGRRVGGAAPTLPNPNSVPGPPNPVEAPSEPSLTGGSGGDRLSIDDIRAILDKPAEVAKTFRVVPVARENQPYGVQIEFRQADNLMAKFGLQHGDIMLSLNGQPIRNAEDVYKAYLAIRNSPSLDFEVDRGGSVLPIRYELAE